MVVVLGRRRLAMKREWKGSVRPKAQARDPEQAEWGETIVSSAMKGKEECGKEGDSKPDCIVLTSFVVDDSSAFRTR